MYAEVQFTLLHMEMHTGFAYLMVIFVKVAILIKSWHEMENGDDPKHEGT